ncbi:protein of unknown function [Sterolibacterium denitrificans]|uniref:Uncharacterized protein n=1 Tax=Sterolibacterium denitrificans TaxID=157592 RepID=A0A7Z7MUY2_9PROT|nr:protein of unknown function [Sterolibacterium denitrificans]
MHAWRLFLRPFTHATTARFLSSDHIAELQRKTFASSWTMHEIHHMNHNLHFSSPDRGIGKDDKAK